MILTEDIAKTILAGCYKFGAATLLRCEGATMTKVIEVYEAEFKGKVAVYVRLLCQVQKNYV